VQTFRAAWQEQQAIGRRYGNPHTHPHPHPHPQSHPVERPLFVGTNKPSSYGQSFSGAIIKIHFLSTVSRDTHMYSL